MEWHYEVFCVTGLCLLGFISFNYSEPDGLDANSGGDWMHFVDDYGKSLVLNFSTIFVETEDTIVGDVYFYLYTRNNEYKPEPLIIPETNEPFKSIYFNKSNEIRVITHGWRSGESVDWVQNIKSSFLREFDMNVVTVDWNELAKNDIYPLAAFSTRYVGSRVAELVETFIHTYSMTGQNFHLIGHSLGAHVMGYAGMFSNETILRITAPFEMMGLWNINRIETQSQFPIEDSTDFYNCNDVGPVKGSKFPERMIQRNSYKFVIENMNPFKETLKSRFARSIRLKCREAIAGKV